MARSYQCWDCGRQVSADEVERYEVARHGMSSGRGGARVYRNRRRVNLCPTCAAKRKRRSSIFGYTVIVVLVVVIVYFVVR